MAKPRKRKKRNDGSHPGYHTQKRFRQPKGTGTKGQYGALVRDRIAYLRTIATKTITFKSKREAERFANAQAAFSGLEYTVTGKTLKLKPIRETAVKRSSEMDRLLSQLRSGGKSARGSKARSLVEFGRRETYWNWSVGETPR